MATWWQKTLAAAASFAGVAGGAYYMLMRRPLPKRRGTLRLQGLHEAVEVITDRYGVPHIYANNEDDLFFAQGFMHAQERLWQMELNRRIGSGRLSEIFGEIAIEADRFSRRLGMHRAAATATEELPQHILRILGAYARGVNSFIERNAHNLSLEFKLLRFKPGPWQIEHSILWGKMMAWNLGGNWDTELIRAHIVAKLGAERAAQLEAGYDPNHPLIVPPGVKYEGVNLGMLEQYEELKQLSGFGMMGGSNNWVVDGTMTVTGSPILCNDPHLGQAAPSVWYECHLVADDIDVVGASFPGTPGVVIGHNRHIAWGITNAISDVEDLYIEKFHPENPHLYEYQGNWEEAQVVREEITVKGSKTPIIEEVRITRHGPILTSMPPFSKSHAERGAPVAEGLKRAPLRSAEAVGTINRPLRMTEDAHAGGDELGQAQGTAPTALRWTGLELHSIVSAVQKMNRASNWEEFRNALRDWDVPPQNMIYADRDGNIGYVMAGAIPIRARGQALLPMPGWTGEYEWTGYIPFDELPQAYNPEQHFIVTANNRVVNDDYPYYITHEWRNGYRAQRIRDLLTSKGKLALSDMAMIQGDQYALPAVEIVPHILKIATDAPLEKAALDVLRSWDYVLRAESAGAAIYMTVLNKLERMVFSAMLGGDEMLLNMYLGAGTNILALENSYSSRSRPLLIRLMNAHDDSWFAHSAISNGPKSWDAAIASALHAAVEELREKLGDDITRWKYGSIHKMTYNHVLSALKPLDKVLNRGPFPLGGDIDTVNMGASLPNKPEVVITVPSYRQIVNLDDMKASLSGHAPGQSGHPASKHYDDFIKPWLNVDHHPMLFERGMIEENAEGTLRIVP